jgi:hypothetical protein
MDELGETFRLWQIRDWSVMPSRPYSRARWPSVEDRRVTLRYVANGQPEIVLTYDLQDRPEDNLRALYLSVESIRKNELRGIGDVVRDAYLQLAAPATQRDPYEVLGVRPDADVAVIDAAYKARAKAVHPDVGGSHEEAKEVNEAYERIKDERGF